MGRPTIYPRDLGRDLVAERAAGTCWKVLTRKYGASRKTLWKRWRAAGGAADPGDGRAANAADEDVSKHLQGFTTRARGR